MLKILIGAFCATVLIIAGVLVSPFFIGPPTAVVASPPTNVPSSDQLIELLIAGRYAEMDEALRMLQERYEAGQVPETSVVRTFDTFSRIDPNLLEPLRDWREANPNSFAPYLALGVYLSAQAWAIRGERVAILTNREKLALMRQYLDDTQSALWGAVRKKPRLPIAWATLISSAMVVGNRHDVGNLYNIALKHIPDSSTLHRRYHYAMSPEWGGSAFLQFALRMELRRRYAGKSEFQWVYFYSDKKRIDMYLFEPPRSWVSPIITMIWGRDAAERVNEFLNDVWTKIFGQKVKEEPAAKALRIIDKIMRYGSDAWLHKRRGDALSNLRRFNEVNSEYAKAISLSPDWPEARVGMARSLSFQRRYRDAQKHWRAAIKIKPYDPNLLVQYTNFLFRIGDKDEADRQIRKALVYGANDDGVRLQAGRLYWVRGMPDHALTEIRKATELAPVRPVNWYFYGLALKRVKSCKAIDAYNTYLELCRNWTCKENSMFNARLEIKNITAGCD